MISDVLHDEVCVGCGIAGSHPEAGFERVAVDELFSQDQHGATYRLTRCWVRCGTCRHIWTVVSIDDRIDADQLAAWLAWHPLRLLPKSAPR